MLPGLHEDSEGAQPHAAEGDAAGGEASGGLRGSTLQPISEQQTPSTPSSAPMGSLTSPAMYSSTASGSASSREDALAPLPARGARHSLTGAIGGPSFASGSASASASGAGLSGKRRAPTELHLHSMRGASTSTVGASRGTIGGGGANSGSSRIESTSTSTSAPAGGHAAVGRAASGTSYELDEADEEAFEEAERERERNCERERERGEEEELDLSTLYVGEETARAALVASQQVKRWWQDVKRARAVQHELHIPNQYMNPSQFQQATDPRWLADAMRAIRSQYRF